MKVDLGPFGGLNIKQSKMPMPDGNCILTEPTGAGTFRVVHYGPLVDLPKDTRADTIWLTAADYDRVIAKLREVC